MLTLFRRIRKGILFSGTTGKYMLYAIGEIALVVIGILIALEVNNHNSNQVNEQQFKAIFTEIKENLVHDINRAEETIQYYNTKDSLIQMVVNNQVTVEMFEENSTLFYLLYYYSAYGLTNNGYNLLNMKLDKLPPEYKEVMPFIHNVYKVYEPLFASTNKYLIDYTYIMLERWSTQHSYYTMTRKEKIDFFMNSNSFKNDALLYTRYSQDSFVRNLHNYIYNAMKAYLLLENKEERGNNDIVSICINNFHPLDTISLSSGIGMAKEEINLAAVTNNPEFKKTIDRTNLYIRNQFEYEVILKSELEDVYISDQIEPESTIYARPIAGSKYEIFKKDGQLVGGFVVPARNTFLLIK